MRQVAKQPIFVLWVLKEIERYYPFRMEPAIMTENQKRRITLMRQQHIGYSAIATELRLSLSTVKAFCRRNGLQADDLASDTQLENKAEKTPDNDLLMSENRGNSTTVKRPRGVENTGFSDGQPVCEVTVSYADEPDEAAVADVLTLLTNASYGR